jgi:peptide/nickel transport system substrate-binding protein
VTNPPTTATDISQVRPGGTLTYLSASEVSTLDPAVIRVGGPVSQGQPLAALFDVLIFQDTTGGISPQVAESITSTDGVTWQLKVRPKVNFTDGTPYDAEAVRFNWQRVLDPATASPNLGAASAIKSLDVVDALTLRITLASAFGQFPRAIARNLAGVGSPTAIRAKGSRFGSEPVGAGPFILKEWIRDSRMVMTRNPNYWNAPRPYLDQVVIRPLPDTVQRTNSLLAAEAQMMIQANLQEGKRAADAGYNIPATILSGGATMDLNNTKPPFNDARVRRAFAYAFNFDEYNSTVENGLNVPVTAMFIKGSPFYDPTLVLPTNNPTEAQKLFDQVASDNGGKATEFTVTGTTTSANRMQYFQAKLSQFKNVKVNVEIVTAAQVVTKSLAKDFQAIVAAHQYVDPEPDFYQALFSGSATNNTGFKNTEMDNALAAGRSSLDVNTRINAYKQVQRIFAEQVPWLYYASLPTETVYPPRVQDVVVIEDGVPLFDRVWFKS